MEIHINKISQREFNDKIEISGIINKNVDPAKTARKILELVNLNPVEVPTKASLVTRMEENRQEKTSMLIKFDSKEVKNKIFEKIKKRENLLEIERYNSERKCSNLHK